MSDLIFSSEQQSVLSQFESSLQLVDLQELFLKPINELDVDSLLILLKAANALYRSGHPQISDITYDSYIAQLKALAPEHEYLATVEPEVISDAKTVALPQKMLSTDKAYSFEAIEKWTDKLVKAARELGVSESEIALRVTPKLDGYAAYDDGNTLYTRGDGVRGQDISRAFERGLQVAESGERGLGPGEIVIKKSYFEDKLSEDFENSRNIQAAIIAEKKVDPLVQQAIDDGACVFYPFALIKDWKGHFTELLSNFESIVEQIWHAVDFDIDGVILETTHEGIKAHMGATRHHHRWQIAYKVNDESAEVEVLQVLPQTSRTGRISPVAELVPTKLSGATISRVTVHHYNMVKTNAVGKGAVVQLVRSGLVIPKIEKVLKEGEVELPETCPSCGSHILWESDHLICPNKSDCPAQTENTLVHFFKTLGNNDGFGPKVVAKLHEQGIKHIHEVYALEHAQLLDFGFGDKTAQNLIDQRLASQQIEIEDWRFLAAFGVSRLGGGNCEKLLQHHELPALFDLSVEQIVSIDGFAQLSAQAIVEGLANIKQEFFKVYDLGFNLALTEKLADKDDSDSAIVGKTIVFTGTMTQGSRGAMEKQAKALGAKVAKSVTGKTSFLVTGEKVGAAKINAAKDKGVEVLSEAEYLQLIGA